MVGTTYNIGYLEGAEYILRKCYIVEYVSVRPQFGSNALMSGCLHSLLNI